MGTIATFSSAGLWSPSDSLIITSPTLSASSCDFVTVQQQLGSEPPFTAAIPPPGTASGTEAAGADSSDSFSDENDEIIWCVSDSSDFGGATLSDNDDDDDDFVVLHRTRPPALEPESLAKAETATTSTGTIRGIPPNIPFGPDSILDDGATDDQDVTWPAKNSEAVPSELGAEFVVPQGEADGTKTPVNPVSSSPASKKERKAKKKLTPEEKEAKRQRKKERKERKKMEGAQKKRTPEEEEARRKRKEEREERKKREGGANKKRTPEEEEARMQRRKEKKEQKKREKKAAQALKELQRGDNEVAKKPAKEKDSKRQKVKDTATTPVTNEIVLPPVVVRGLSKSASATTIVLPSSTVSRPKPSPSNTKGAGSVPAPPGAQCTPSSPSSETLKAPGADPKPSKKKKQTKGKAVSPPVPPLLASGSLVCSPVIAEKVSEQASGYNSTSEAYGEAVDYITSFLSNPLARRDQACHLALLQSLIIELGLLTDRRLLPQSITSAKTLIRKHVFINIKEYLTKRHEGQTAVKGLMHRSKSALVRDLKRKKNFASPAWVKERGLQDLLVPAFHHH